MKKFNKASKLFIAITAILALSVMLSCVALCADANVIENYGASADAYCAYRWNIKKINFVTGFDGSEDSDVIESWDISEKNDGSVKAWLKPYSDATVQQEGNPIPVAPQDVRYELFIGADGKITAPEDMSYFFKGFSNLVEINGFENLDTSEVTTMKGMFMDSSSLKSLDLSALSTGKVTDMSYMFYGCASVEEFCFEGFNTENVLYMNHMFAGCSSVKELHIDSFDTQKVINSQNMFDGCEELLKIYVGNEWLFVNVKSSDNMFRNCYFLVGKIKYDPTRLNATYASTEYYTLHASILDPVPINLKFTDSLIYGERKSVTEYTGYYYYNMVDYFVSDNPAVVSITADGIICADKPGRATITAKLKDGVEGSIVLIFSVEEIAEEQPLLGGFLGQLLGVFMGWFENIKNFFTSLIPF